MEVLEGIISVRAAITAGNREIEAVYVDGEKFRKRDRKITSFVSFLKANGIRAEFCERGVIDAFVKNSDENAGNTHGGVCAAVGERKYMTVSQLLEKTAEEKGFLVYLDGVEDPFNLGYAVRALYAAGASGLVLPKRDRHIGAGVLARSSAGASELMCIAEFEGNDDKERRLSLIKEIKSYGITLACAAVSEKSVPLFEYNSGFPVILFIGGEKRGISPEFVDNADCITHIPYASPSVRYSLPTATVAAITAFELMRLKG